MHQVPVTNDNVLGRRRRIFHLSFWLFVLAVYVIFFGRQSSSFMQTSFFVGLLMPVTIAASRFLNYYLVPQFLLRERYALFLLYLTYTLIAAVFLAMMIALVTFFLLADTRTSNMSPASIDLFFLLTSFLSVIFLALAIKLLLHWRTSREDVNRLRLEKAEAELRFLKAQLNPHFLFNTLNNLYYLALEKSDATPQVVLHLSGILDYVLQSGKLMQVTLEQELKHVQDYIALELLHYEDRLSILYKATGVNEGHKIAPMIVMTLVENAFKHGVMKVKGRAEISVNVQCSDDRISVSVRNTFEPGSVAGIGTGLTNLRSQLDLIYKSNYRLKLGQTDDKYFSVELDLPVDK